MWLNKHEEIIRELKGIMKEDLYPFGELRPVRRVSAKYAA